MKLYLLHYLMSGHALQASIAIRTGYLLSKEMICVGDVHFPIFFGERADFTNVNEMLQAMIETARENDPEDLKTLLEIAETMKTFRKMRNKPPAVLIAMKKMEIEVKRLFDSQLKKYDDSFRTYGFPQLHPLMHHGIEALNVDEEDPELEKDQFMKLSKALLHHLPEYNESEFENYPIISNDIASKTGHQAFQNHLAEKGLPAARPYMEMQQLLQPQNLQVLNITELQSIKADISNAIEPWHQSILQWASLIKEDMTKAYDWFQSEVLPASQQLQSVLDDHPVFKTYQALHNTKGHIGFCAGIYRLGDIFNYYHIAGILPEVTSHALEKEMKANPNIADHPVLIFAPDFGSIKEADLAEANEAQASKKYLDI